MLKIMTQSYLELNDPWRFRSIFLLVLGFYGGWVLIIHLLGVYTVFPHGRTHHIDTV
jgi:hypothetical protein